MAKSGSKKGTKYNVIRKYPQYEYGSYEYNKSAYIKHMYGITLDDYTQLFENQEGRCAICGKHQLETKGKLKIDHCHSTGKVRGLLCHSCNIGIGLFGDNPNTLELAKKYLTKSLEISK